MLTNSNSVQQLQQPLQPQYRSPSPAAAAWRTSASETSSVELLKKQKFELSIADEAVVHALEEINRHLAGIPREVEYSLHRGDGQMVIKIVNSETKEVLKEIPPEKILDMLAKFRELNQSAGAVIDEKR